MHPVNPPSPSLWGPEHLLFRRRAIVSVLGCRTLSPCALWDATGSCQRGIPATAKPLGLRFDGWASGYQSLSLPQQLLQALAVTLKQNSNSVCTLTLS